MSVGDEWQEEHRRLVEWVRERLRQEINSAPRGYAAALATKLKLKAPHISNVIATRPTRDPGEQMIRILARHWGMTYAQLEEIAQGATDAPFGPLQQAISHSLGLGISQEAIDRVLSSEPPAEHPERTALEWHRQFLLVHSAMTRKEIVAIPSPPPAQKVAPKAKARKR